VFKFRFRWGASLGLGSNSLFIFPGIPMHEGEVLQLE
jgi:hypothetical protein